MEDLLKKYLREKFSSAIEIMDWQIDGSCCYVQYYYDNYDYDTEHIVINIWDMVVFLNK